MLKPTYAMLASVLLLASTSACKTVGESPPANATDRSRTSWCQGDSTIGYAQADEAAQNDPGNAFDTDATVAEIQAHNARLRAACPAAE